MNKKILLTILTISIVILTGCNKQIEVTAQHNTPQTDSNITKSTAIDTNSSNENPDKQNRINGKEFIGLEYTDLPKGISEQEGMLLEGDYCLEYISKENIQMVWLEKAFYNNDGKVQYYKVLDVIVSPKNDEKYTFALDGNYLNDEYVHDIITFVERTTQDYWNISYAWRVDLGKKQFEQIKTNGLKCENTTFDD